MFMSLYRSSLLSLDILVVQLSLKLLVSLPVSLTTLSAVSLRCTPYNHSTETSVMPKYSH